MTIYRVTLIVESPHYSLVKEFADDIDIDADEYDTITIDACHIEEVAESTGLDCADIATGAWEEV